MQEEEELRLAIWIANRRKTLAELRDRLTIYIAAHPEMLEECHDRLDQVTVAGIRNVWELAHNSTELL